MKVTGVEQVDGEDHYRLEKINKSTGDKHVDFYSVKTGLSSKSITPIMTAMGKLKIESMASDYRKVGKSDLITSHKSVQKLPGNIVQEVLIEKIELNPKIDESVFKLPEVIVKLKKTAAEKKARAAKKKESTTPAKK